MKNGKRDYRRQYDLYEGKPENIKKRSTRNQAHAKYESKHGDTKKDVDHRKPLSKGGTNSLANLIAVSASSNRSFQRDSKSKVVSQTSKRERSKRK